MVGQCAAIDDEGVTCLGSIEFGPNDLGIGGLV